MEPNLIFASVLHTEDTNISYLFLYIFYISADYHSTAFCMFFVLAFGGIIDVQVMDQNLPLG